MSNPSDTTDTSERPAGISKPALGAASVSRRLTGPHAIGRRELRGVARRLRARRRDQEGAKGEEDGITAAGATSFEGSQSPLNLGET